MIFFFLFSFVYTQLYTFSLHTIPFFVILTPQKQILQSTLTEEAQLAYESLIETPTPETTTTITSPQFHRHTLGMMMDHHNPLRMLRSGNLPMIKPRIRTVATLPLSNRRQQRHILDNELEDDDVFVGNSDVQSGTMFHRGHQPCSSVSDESNCGEHDNGHPPSYSEFQRDDNPIPLPPRDRTKPKPASKPRHTRKHPLIIPASSIQRTLNKVNVTTPEEVIQNLDFTGNPIKIIPDGKMLSEPSYINHNPFDNHSIHFEAQIESELAALDHIEENNFKYANNIDTVDGGPMKPYSNDKIISLHLANGGGVSTNEDKPKNTVTNKGVDVILRHNTDHVSCEDLLEFADTKPSSKARGLESDEVRIMSKVLGIEVSVFFLFQS